MRWKHRPTDPERCVERVEALYERAPGTLRSLRLVPEFQLVVALLLGLSALGALWSPLRLALPLLALSLGALVWGAVSSALAAFRTAPPPPDLRRPRWIALTTLLHLLQPVARLGGRLRGDRITFKVGNAEYTGSVSGDSMKGNVTGGAISTWSASRRP